MRLIQRNGPTLRCFCLRPCPTLQAYLAQQVSNMKKALSSSTVVVESLDDVRPTLSVLGGTPQARQRTFAHRDTCGSRSDDKNSRRSKRGLESRHKDVRQIVRRAGDKNCRPEPCDISRRKPRAGYSLLPRLPDRGYFGRTFSFLSAQGSCSALPNLRRWSHCFQE